MGTTEPDVVVLGAGTAAGYLAREWVKAGGGGGGRLCLIGDEGEAPYERPPLSKGFLLGKKAAAEFRAGAEEGEPQGAAWYAEHGITLLHGAVERVDVAARRVVLRGGQAVAWRRAAVAATGAEAAPLSCPGAALRGVCPALRSLRDAEGARRCLTAAAAAGAAAVIVGGGYIGVEAACVAAELGLRTVLVFPEGHVMPRLFTPAVAAAYERALAARGVELRKGCTVARVVDGGGGAAAACVLSDGRRVDCGAVVAGCGIRPATAPLRGACRLTPRGDVAVDATLCSSTEGVYAIGDCAAFPGPSGGALCNPASQKCCRQQAKHLAATLLTDGAPPPPFNYLPCQSSKVFDMAWRVWGDTEGSDATACRVDGPSVVAVWIRGGVLTAALLGTAADAPKKARGAAYRGVSAAVARRPPFAAAGAALDAVAAVAAGGGGGSRL